jgi:hypothetical protein
MKKITILFSLIIIVFSVKSQQIPVRDLISMLGWTPKRIDTTLKKTGYILMRREVDSSGSMLEYSHVNRDEETPVTVRSLVYMDVTVRDLKSRLITYRTYDIDEYRDMLSFMLANNYHSTGKYDFKEAKHTVYNNGSREIRVKEITTVSKNKRKYIAYEFELGQ